MRQDGARQDGARRVGRPKDGVPEGGVPEDGRPEDGGLENGALEARGRNGGRHRFRLVVVGGGVAGLEVATRLGRTLGRRGEASITLVDRCLAHVWKPNLHRIAAGTEDPDRAKVGFLAHARRHHYRFRPGALTGVDRVAHTVTIGPFDGGDGTDDAGLADRTIPYDALVLAIGSRANDFGTPGVAAHCRTIDSFEEAGAFHLLLRRLIFSATEANRPFSVAIVGGGATGVELAAEIKQALDYGARYGAAPSLLRLTLLEAGDRLLPAFPARVADDVARSLGALGITVRLGATVAAADAEGFQLADGTRVEASLRVWAAGVKAPAALDLVTGLDRSRTGQIVVTPNLQAKGDPAIVALGDCASIDGPDGRAVPATAQAARQEALHFARHAADLMLGRRMPDFHYRARGALVSLADYNGWGTLGRYTFGGGRLRGLSARLAHDMLYRQHQVEVHGAARSAAIWITDGLDAALRPPVRLD